MKCFQNYVLRLWRKWNLIWWVWNRFVGPKISINLKFLWAFLTRHWVLTLIFIEFPWSPNLSLTIFSLHCMQIIFKEKSSKNSNKTTKKIPKWRLNRKTNSTRTTKKNINSWSLIFKIDIFLYLFNVFHEIFIHFLFIHSYNWWPVCGHHWCIYFLWRIF